MVRANDDGGEVRLTHGDWGRLLLLFFTGAAAVVSAVIYGAEKVAAEMVKFEGRLTRLETVQHEYGRRLDSHDSDLRRLPH